jgi:hypothetical protein
MKFKIVAAIVLAVLIGFGAGFGIEWQNAQLQLADVKAQLEESKNWANHMESSSNEWRQAWVKLQTHPVPPRICTETYDMPGVRRGVGYYVREWNPRPDGACNSGDAPHEGVFVLGDDYYGGSLGCKNIDASVTWRPRPDGFCYGNDAPK